MREIYIKCTFIFFFVLIQSTVFAQRPEEILNYSTFGNYGSARVVGLAGAMNAVGADATLISHNPAALGAFWRSEVSLGLNLVNTETSSRLNGGPSASATESLVQFGHAAYVNTTYDPDRKVMAQSFSIGLNRLGDFDSEFVFEHKNPGSITEYWLALADGFAPDELNSFQEGLAYDAEALYDDGEFYYTDYLGREDLPLARRQIVQESGYNNELFIAYGANVNNKWMFGASIGIPFFNYSYNKTYQEAATPEYESSFDDTTARMSELRFSESLETSGVGINLKVGAIYKLNDMVRVSAAVHTPTLYGVEDNAINALEYEYIENNVPVNNQVTSPQVLFDYEAISAWRGLLGAAFMFEKNGFINAELEYVGLNGSQYNLTSNEGSGPADLENENNLNNAIEESFRNVLNLRIGGEYATGKFRARAGVRLDGSPYEDASDFNSTYALGLGYRGDRFYLDAAYSAGALDRRYEPYPVDGFNEQVVTQTIDRNQFILTFGYKL